MYNGNILFHCNYIIPFLCHYKSGHDCPQCEYYYNECKIVHSVGIISTATFVIGEKIKFKINKNDPTETYMPTTNHKKDLFFHFLFLLFMVIFWFI